MNKLLRSDVTYFIIEDEMEGVLTVLNRDGEVVVKASYFDDRPVIIKIFATDNEGIVVQQFDPDTWEFNGEL